MNSFFLPGSLKFKQSTTLLSIYYMPSAVLSTVRDILEASATWFLPPNQAIKESENRYCGLTLCPVSD